MLCCPNLSHGNSHDRSEYTDWIVDKRNPLCGGYYLAPELGSINSQDPLEWSILADNILLQAKGRSELRQNVEINRGNTWLFADQAWVEQDQIGKLVNIELNKRVRLQTPQMRLDATKVTVDSKNNISYLEQVDYKAYQQHARGSAKSAVIQEKNLKLKSASYTTCEPGNDLWSLQSNKIVLDQTAGSGEAWHTNLYVGKVPVFYWPYLKFPLDEQRTSGFLTPHFGYQSKLGAVLALPIYWNIHPRVDATIMPSYMSKRGVKIDSQMRYALNNSRGVVELDFLSDQHDKHGVRKRVLFKHMQQMDNWSLQLNWQSVSDNNYWLDFLDQPGTGILDALSQQNLNGLARPRHKTQAIHMFQGLQLQHQHKLGLFTMRLQQHQSLAPSSGLVGSKQYKKLPEVIWQSREMVLPYGMSTQIMVEHAAFKLLKTQQRQRLRWALSMGVIKPAWVLEPKLQLDVAHYNIDSLQKKNKILPLFSVDSKVNLERGSHALEPRIFYLLVPQSRQEQYPIFDSTANVFDYYQLYRDNRYVGGDRISEANQITLGLESRWFKQANGQERLMLGIGRIRYFRQLTPRLGEKFTAKQHWSPLAMLGRMRINSRCTWDSQLIYANSSIESMFSSLQYKAAEDCVYNLGYQYTKQHKGVERLQQLTASSGWAFTPKVHVLGALEYDLKRGKSNKLLGGVEYHTCCTILRVGCMWRDKNYQFMAQIVLKGLTGVGRMNKHFLREHIPGYVAQEKSW